MRFIVYKRDEYETSHLFKACEKGYDETVHLLLDKGQTIICAFKKWSRSTLYSLTKKADILPLHSIT